MNYTLTSVSQMPVQIRTYQKKIKHSTRDDTRRAPTHEVQEEQPAGPPQGDPQGDRRAKRRLGVGRGAAAAAGSDAGAGLRPHNVHEARALLRAVRDLAGDSTHANFRRHGRGPQAAEALTRRRAKTTQTAQTARGSSGCSTTQSPRRAACTRSGTAPRSE